MPISIYTKTDQEVPMLDAFEFNTNAAMLLAVAEQIIYDECCRNGCTHNSEHMSGHPIHCASFAIACGLPLECASFSSGEQR